MKKEQTKNLVVAALCLALCMVLPFLTGQIKEIGNMLLPMHLPVMLCGFVCGGPWGLAVGFVAPLMRSVLFIMPSMFPDALAMAFELAAYGFVAGAMYRSLPKKAGWLYVSLATAMVLGRAVWGVAYLVMAKFFQVEFSLKMFFAGAFLTAWPGIILQLLLIPPLVALLRRAGLVKEPEKLST